MFYLCVFDSLSGIWNLSWSGISNADVTRTAHHVYTLRVTCGILIIHLNRALDTGTAVDSAFRLKVDPLPFPLCCWVLFLLSFGLTAYLSFDACLSFLLPSQHLASLRIRAIGLT